MWWGCLALPQVGEGIWRDFRCRQASEVPLTEPACPESVSTEGGRALLCPALGRQWCPGPRQLRGLQEAGGVLVGQFLVTARRMLVHRTWQILTLSPPFSASCPSGLSQGLRSGDDSGVCSQCSPPSGVSGGRGVCLDQSRPPAPGQSPGQG